MARTPAPKSQLQNLMTAEDLAVYLGRSVRTIRHDASRAPHRLPPRVRLPDSSLLRWQADVVHAWVQQFQEEYKPKAKRGRPRLPL